MKAGRWLFYFNQMELFVDGKPVFEDAFKVHLRVETRKSKEQPKRCIYNKDPTSRATCKSYDAKDKNNPNASHPFVARCKQKRKTPNDYYPPNNFKALRLPNPFPSQTPKSIA
jgi:hypothetical protein